MDMFKIRKANLAALIGEKYGAAADFARKHDLDPTYISQLMTGHRNMGEKAARKIERHAELPVGFLDQFAALGEQEAIAAIKDALYRAAWLTDENRKQILGLIQAIKS